MKISSIRIGMVAGGLFLTYVLPISAQRTRERGWDMTVASGTSTTQISGDAGTASVVTGPAGTVVTSLEFFEQSDRPCRIVVGFSSWNLNADQAAVDVDYRTRQTGGSCSGSPQRVAASGPGRAVSGIMMCQRRRNNRIKGAQLHAKQLLPNGLGNGVGTSFERPNCNNQWQAWVDCPTGQVSTGVVVHSGNGSITGVALRCSNVTWQRQGYQRIDLGNPIPMLTTTGSTPGTGISGLSASERVLSAPLPNMGLRKITFGERNDRPCYLQAEFWTDNPTPTSRTVTFNECQGNQGSERSVEIATSTIVVQLASSIAICQRQGNDRLKGITLLGSRIDATGATPDSAISDQEVRTNCNDQNDPEHCTVGSVITAIQVHFRPSQNRPAEIVGLGPICSIARRG